MKWWLREKGSWVPKCFPYGTPFWEESCPRDSPHRSSPPHHDHPQPLHPVLSVTPGGNAWLVSWPLHSKSRRLAHAQQAWATLSSSEPARPERLSWGRLKYNRKRGGWGGGGQQTVVLQLRWSRAPLHRSWGLLGQGLCKSRSRSGTLSPRH